MNGPTPPPISQALQFDELVRWYFTSSVPPWIRLSSSEASRPPPSLTEIAAASLIAPAYWLMHGVLILPALNPLQVALFFTLSPLLATPLLFWLSRSVSYAAAINFIAWFCRMAALLILLVTLAGLSLSQHACGNVKGIFYSFDLWFFLSLAALCGISFLLWRKAESLPNRDGINALIAFAAASLLLRLLFMGDVSDPWFNFPAFCNDLNP